MQKNRIILAKYLYNRANESYLGLYISCYLIRYQGTRHRYLVSYPEHDSSDMLLDK